MGNFLYYTFKTADLQDKYNYMFSFGWHIKQNYFRYDTKKNTETKFKNTIKECSTDFAQQRHHQKQKHNKFSLSVVRFKNEMGSPSGSGNK